MKKVDCIFYLVDSELHLYEVKKEKYEVYELKNIIYQGRIIKPKQFIKKINDILLKNKISKIFSSLNAVVIYKITLKYIDKKIIIDTFNECNFKNIKMISTKSLLEKNKTLIDLNRQELTIYQNNKYYKIDINSFIDLEESLKILEKKIGDDIILIGNNPKIAGLESKIINIFYYEDNSKYYIKKLIKNMEKIGN